MKFSEDIIVKPIITEKSYAAMAEGKYTFEVALDATKLEIKDAVEKLWDALERLKTYYTTLDKKASVTQIVNAIASGQTSYIDLFNLEFKALTDIGNNYRIRHHETNKIDITDIRHYDYFFNRCLSLIGTAIQYLK